MDPSLSSILSCPVCYDPFQQQKPKILPCGHTACETCIETWIHHNNPPKVQCPLCMKRFKETAAKDLPTNFCVLQMVEKLGGGGEGENGGSSNNNGDGGDDDDDDDDEDEDKKKNEGGGGGGAAASGRKTSDNNDSNGTNGESGGSNGHKSEKKKKSNNKNNNANNEKNSNKNEKVCEIGRCARIASHVCLECPQDNQWFCTEHLHAHNAFKAFVDHRPIRAEDFDEEFEKNNNNNNNTNSSSSAAAAAVEGDKTNSSAPLTTCKLHRGQPLTIFCEQCEVPICTTCALLTIHKTHEYSEIGAACASQRKKLVELLTQAKTEMEELMNAQKTAVAMKETIDEQEKVLAKEIEVMAKELQRGLRRIAEERKKELEEQSETLLSSVNEGEKICKEVSSILHDRNFVWALREKAEKMRQLKQHLENSAISAQQQRLSTSSAYSPTAAGAGGSSSSPSLALVNTRDLGIISKERIDDVKDALRHALQLSGSGGDSIFWDGDEEAEAGGGGGGGGGARRSFGTPPFNSMNGHQHNASSSSSSLRRYNTRGNSVFSSGGGRRGSASAAAAGGGNISDSERSSRKRRRADRMEIRFTRTISGAYLPNGIAWTRSGNLLVASFGGGCVQELRVDGTFVRQIGSKGIGDGKFSHPMGLCVSHQGEIFVTDYDRHCVLVFSDQGEFLRKFGSEGSGPGQLNKPWGICATRAIPRRELAAGYGNSNNNNSNGNGGNANGINGNNGNNNNEENNRGVAAAMTDDNNNNNNNNNPDSNNNNNNSPPVEIFVADQFNNRIQVFSSSGNLLRSFGSEGNRRGEMLNPANLALDENGNVYVSECGGHRIQVFSRDGSFIRMFGRKGDHEGEMNRPHGIAVDNYTSSVIVSDFENDRLSIWSFEGEYISSVTVPDMEKPMFIALDHREGRLAVSSFEDKDHVFLADL